MREVKNRILRYYQGIVEVPCEIQYDYNPERGNKKGWAYITIFLSQITVHGRPYEKVKGLDDFKFELDLNRNTRKAKQSLARQRASSVGKGLISKLRTERVISFSRKK